MTVYIVQKQMRFDHHKQEFVPRFDSVEKAEEYGDIVYLLSPTAAPFKPAPIIKELEQGLCHFGKDDYLLLIGNPVLIGLATAIAADNCGVVNFLQWHGKEQRYLPVTAKVFDFEDVAAEQ